MVSLLLSKKFNPFGNNFFDVFLNYKKNFNLPKCFKLKKKCKCFSKRKEIEFSFDYPMSFIQIHKHHISKNIFALEKHNNLKILLLHKSSNIVQRKEIKMSMLNHFETLDIFSKFIVSVEKRIPNYRRIKFQKFIRQRKNFCENYLTSIKNENSVNSCPLIVLSISFYNHYHTLKMFESFVNKLK